MKKTMLLMLAVFLTLALAAGAEEDDDYCSHNWSLSGHRSRDCTHYAVDYYVCTNCGETYSDYVGQPWGHKWGGWTTTKEATCTSAGSKSRTCSRCGAKEKQTIAQLPHTFESWQIIVEATDHSSGQRSGVCKVCGSQVTEEFDPEGTLRKKSEGEDVRELQSMLFCRGFLKKSQITGKYNKATENAVKKCQEAEGFVADGIAWPQTIARLGHQYGEWNILSVKSDFSIGRKERTCALCGYTVTVEDAPSPMLKRKDKGDEVKALQQALNDAGFNCGSVDGDFGRQTERAVLAFEKEKGLPVEDGIAWPGVMKLIPNLKLPGIEKNRLLLTITQVPKAGEGYDEDDEITVEWTLLNPGDQDCSRWSIVPVGVDSERALVAGTLPLKADNGNVLTGRCEISIDSYASASGMAFKAVGSTGDAEFESEETSLQ